MILGLDTCGHACSVALVSEDSQTAYAATSWMARGHAAALPALTALAALDLGRVCAIVVTRGPGGFTGMRTGLAYARAFSLARHIPAFGISVDAALRLTVPAATHIAIDSRRGDFFVAGKVLTRQAVEALDGPIAGSWGLSAHDQRVGWHEPCPVALAAYGWRQLQSKSPADPLMLEPLYIRAPSVS